MRNDPHGRMGTYDTSPIKRKEQPKLTVEEAEALRSGWLMQSAVGKVSPAMRRYFGAERKERPVRAAIVTYAERSTVERYLPASYSVRTSLVVDGRIAWLVVGEDNYGWTLDGYVIPRLASGLIPAYECDPETGARLEDA